MSKVFKSNLSTEGLNNLIKELEDYKKGISVRTARAIEILAEKGVTCAEEVALRSGGMGRRVVFRATVPQIEGSNVTAIMEGIDYKFEVRWYQADGTTKSAIVSALLMLEFGSGVYADEAHRGTFPTDTKHGLDLNGWNYKDDEGWHHAWGYIPKQPMLNAYNKMKEEIRSAFEEAFRN